MSISLGSGAKNSALPKKFHRWFFEGVASSHKSAAAHTDSWWKIMCLTGVDYFSTLGYQPGIAFLAAGLLSPIATLIVVLVTLFGLLPLYKRVAAESPHGQGSIAMLENLLPGWSGKTLVLILLGFAATDFVITITLSAADATAHIVQNPMVPAWIDNRIAITSVMLAILAGVFLKGFREAIGLSVIIVSAYLVLNLVVISRASIELFNDPSIYQNWQSRLFAAHHSPGQMLALSLLLFPKLALGMSGFETGVAVMPLVKGGKNDSHERPLGRIENTGKLLFTAAMIMAIALLSSSFLSTLLIPAELFKDGAEANGRALAYLAHKYLGEGFGSVYDISTILILWFAGASAMAGLLNLVPRYLPRYGMAPDWARAQRPLVLLFALITFSVTWIFKADVDAQAGAYATGVLVLFTSAAFAVVLASWNEGWQKRALFLSILLVFIYTSIANMIERPEGLHIASLFIATILLTSLLSRALRSMELRVLNVSLDEKATSFVNEILEKTGQICLLAHRPGSNNFIAKERETRAVHKLSPEEASFLFLEVNLSDPSEFTGQQLEVRGKEIDGIKILQCDSPAIPNAIAALLLHLRSMSESIPHAYFGWTEGHPFTYIFKYIFLGEGETAPVTREILRKVEPDPDKRPKIIVG